MHKLVAGKVKNVQFSIKKSKFVSYCRSIDCAAYSIKNIFIFRAKNAQFFIRRAQYARYYWYIDNEQQYTENIIKNIVTFSNVSLTNTLPKHL